MSIEYCFDHARHWDSDYDEECPECASCSTPEFPDEDLEPSLECSECGSTTFTYLGQLGDRRHFRCRYCRADYSHTVEADEDEVWENLEPEDRIDFIETSQ